MKGPSLLLELGFSQITVLTLLMVISQLSSAQIAKPGQVNVKPTVTNNSKAKPKTFSGNCTVIIEMDAEGVLFVDYEKIWDYQKGEVWKSPIQSGEHFIKFSNGIDEWSETITIKSGQKIIKTELAKASEANSSIHQNSDSEIDRLNHETDSKSISSTEDAPVGLMESDICKGYAQCSRLNSNLFTAWKSGAIGCLNEFGDVVLPFEYQMISANNSGKYENGYFHITTFYGKWGVIDSYGNIMVPAIYSDPVVFFNDLACIPVDGKYGFINTSGEMTIPAIYDKPSLFITKEGNAAGVFLNGKAIHIDRSGTILELKDIF